MSARAGTPALACLALAASACVSASIEPDVRHAAQLARVERLAPVESGEVESGSEPSARQLLAHPLEADAAVRVALLNNRELRAQLRELGIYRGRLIEASTLPNPRAEVELLPERNSGVELRVEYDITRALLSPLESGAERSELDAARSRLAAQIVSLGYRVRAAVYRLMVSERRRGIGQRLLDGLVASRDAVRAMSHAGNSTPLELANEEVAYERARIRVARLELNVATDRERLQRLLGLHGRDTAWRLAGEIAAVPAELSTLEQLETRALRASLEMRGRRQRLEALSQRVRFTRSLGWLPDLAVDVHGLHGNPDPEVGSEADRDWRFGAGLSVEVPIFDRRQGEVTALEAEFDALLERYYGLAIDVRSAARDLHSRLSSAHARARQYQEVIVPLQRRVTEQTLLQYNAMQIGLFQLLAARQEELEAELALADALGEFWTASAELEALLAGQRVTAEAGPEAFEGLAPVESRWGH